MKVILKQDVNKIGKAGEILEVSDGYGRNYLIARGLAEEGTPSKIRENEEFKKTQKVKDDKKLKLAEEAKVALRNIRRNANADVEKTGETEDEVKAGKEDVQNLTNEFVKKIDQIAKEKEKDLMTV